MEEAVIGWNIDFEVSYQMPADTAKCPLKGDTSDQRLAKHVAKLNKDRRDMETQRRRLDSTKDIEKVATAVEEQIRIACSEVILKQESTLYRVVYSTERSRLREKHDREKRELQERQTKYQNAVQERRAAKSFRSQTLTQRKKKESKIYNQKIASRFAALGRAQLKQKYAELDEDIKYCMNKHGKRVKQLVAKQKRAEEDRHLLLEVEIKELNVSGDAKNELLHSYTFKDNHHKSLDKRNSEHMREMHSNDLLFVRAFGDLEIRMMDQFSELQLKHTVEKHQLQESNGDIITAMKLKIKNARMSIKDCEIAIEQDLERLKLENQQEVEMYEMYERHSQLDNKRLLGWSDKIERKLPLHELCYGVYEKPAKPERQTQFLPDQHLRQQLDEATKRFEVLQEDLVKEKQKATARLKSLITRQNAEFQELKATRDYNVAELEARQELEFATIWKKQKAEIDQLIDFQNLEKQTEAFVRAAEVGALFERTVLSSLLDNVADGVVTISTTGKIERFNQAAEIMFGYPRSEAQGHNVKMLMDTSFAKNHDSYLLNYLETGTKKVIGTGRQIFGKKKNDEKFPIYLSVSEVKGVGYQFFTGIINDLTEEIAKKNAIKAEEDRKKMETQKMLDSLAVYTDRSTKLLEQLLPEDFASRIMKGETPQPRSYDTCTIFFSDIVGFTSIAGAASAMEVVDLLNDLYTYFDAVIDRYDCYKVETIGDAYNVVSGIPTPNGDNHAMQIVDMALHLLHGIYKKIVIRHNGQKMQIRIGCHTGPCVAGIVGVKMPRYCLFGNHVNFASEMESSGSPMRIQVSHTTYKILKKTGNYIMQERDRETNFLKGTIKTYWVFGRAGFDLELPNPDDWPVLSHKKG